MTETCYLELRTEKSETYPNACDGCGRKYSVGEVHVSNIDSCCGGGCCRSLCADCMRASLKLLEATP